MQYFEKENDQKMNYNEENKQQSKKKVHFIVNNKKQDKTIQSSPKINERLRSAKFLTVNQVN